MAEFDLIRHPRHPSILRTSHPFYPYGVSRQLPGSGAWSLSGKGIGGLDSKGLLLFSQNNAELPISGRWFDLLFRFLEPDNILKGKGCYVQFRKPNTKPDPNLLSSVVELVDENGKYEAYHQYPIDEIKNSSLSHINIDSIKTGVSSDTTGSPKNPPANLKKSS